MRVLNADDLRWVSGGQPSYSGSNIGEEVTEGDSVWTWDGSSWIETVIITAPEPTYEYDLSDLFTEPDWDAMNPWDLEEDYTDLYTPVGGITEWWNMLKDIFSNEKAAQREQKLAESGYDRHFENATTTHNILGTNGSQVYSEQPVTKTWDERYWIDANRNGTPDLEIKLFDGVLRADRDGNGTFETDFLQYMWSPLTNPVQI